MKAKSPSHYAGRIGLLQFITDSRRVLRRIREPVVSDDREQWCLGCTWHSDDFTVSPVHEPDCWWLAVRALLRRKI